MSVVERWVTVSAPGGLHARTAARIVQAVRRLGARVTITHGDRAADATSLVSLLGLGVSVGGRVRVVVEGDEAEAALEQVRALLTASRQQRIYRGRGVAPGVGIGRGVIAVDVGEMLVTRGWLDHAAEIRRLHQALAEARAQLEALEVWAARAIGQASSVLYAERALLDDAVWVELLEDSIRNQGLSAEAAVWAASRQPGPVLPSTAGDGPTEGLREVLRDVGTRVGRILTHRQPDALESPYEGSIVLVGYQVSPSELLEWPREQLAGVATVLGSAQSHATVVARALRVPMVVGIDAEMLATVAAEVDEGLLVRVDGGRGQLVIDPDALEEVTDAAVDRWRAPSRVEAKGPILWANADTPDEVRRALDAGAKGIGLTRTERLFLGRDVPPDEEEQYQAFRELAMACGGRRLTLRLADLGGDKVPPYLVPLFGIDSQRWRGAGLLARYPALAVPHLRALARVASTVASEVTIMVPMVATRADWEAILGHWHEVAGALGVATRVSLLVETPSAALDIAELLPSANEVAIGANDLAVLLFGGNRERGSVVVLPTLQPVALRLVADVTRRARDAGVPVTVCGEAAGQLPDALLLWGIGVDGLSIAPDRVPIVRQALEAVDGAEVRRVARDVVGMRDVREVLARLERWRRDLASRDITIKDWPEGWEGRSIAHQEFDSAR